MVNTNVASLNAQRSLAASGAELKTAMERLSAGKKINSAADDAAGFAIAERMTAQVRGLNMAVKNATDGLSLLSVAENSLSDVTDILQRIRELSVQAANGTNSASDKSNLAAEASSLISEIDRIVSDTTFNDIKVLAGFSQEVKVQLGVNDGDLVKLEFSGSYSSMLGIPAGFGKAEALAAFGVADLASNGSHTVIDLSSYAASEAKIDDVLNHDNWSGSSWGHGTPDGTNQPLTASINFEDGSRYSVVTFRPDNKLTIGASLGELTSKAGMSWSVSAGGVSDINLSQSPSSALTTIDLALNQIASEKSRLGASQNRLGYAVSNLMNVAENTTAARSRIRDADFAIEAARLAKAQVLQQSGAAMLAQANSAPQVVLNLIR